MNVRIAAPAAARPARGPRARWRVVDIVVASVLAVAAGLVFELWNLGAGPVTTGLGLVVPGFQGLANGMWLFAGPLVALVVRKPGAALYGELVAAAVEAVIGNQWGWLTLESGLVQGLGAEIVVAVLVYRAWSLPVVVIAGAATGVAEGINDSLLWYAGYAFSFQVVYTVCTAVSGAVIAGLGSWWAVRALARTGVLAQFAAGRR